MSYGKFFTNNVYKDNSDERMYREDVKPIWHDISGSKTEFRFNQYGVRMYLSTTMIINQGVISGNIYEYKPMFQIRFFDSQNENKNFNLLLNSANCQFLSSALKILVEDSSIVTFFNKSDTSGWYVKQQYKGVKAMPTKEFSKAAFVEIFPETDDRRLPAYKFRWCKDQQEVICIFTKGEIITLLSRMDGFVDQCPLYVNIFENEILKKKLEIYSEQVSSLQSAVYTLSTKMDDVLKEVKMSNEQTKTHFSTALNSILTVFASMNQQPNISPKQIIQENVATVMEETKIEEDEEDGFILSKSNKANEFFEEAGQQKNIVEMYDLPEVDKTPESLLFTAEEQPNGYFNTPAMYAGAVLEEVQQKVNSEEAKTIDGLFTEPIIDSHKEVKEIVQEVLSMEEFTETKKEKPVWEIDQYTQFLKEKFQFEFTNDPKQKGGNVVPISVIYPDVANKYTTEEVESANVCVSCLPDEKKEVLKTINLDNILENISRTIESNKKYSIAHYLLDTKMFTRAYIAGMLINKGRVGIPVSSIVYATAIYATAYELIEKGQDATKIANECGMHILNCFIETPKISKEKNELYNKYFTALATELTGHETTEFNKYLFGLDKMLLRGMYEFSAFDLKLETLDEKEKTCVAKALTDVYIMLYYAEKEHMSFNSQSSPNFELYFLVNKLMYRFARAMLVNLIRCNKECVSVKQAILQISFDYQKVCERLNWEKAKYNDAMITFFVTNEMSKKYVEPFIDSTPMDDTIKGTNIYRGMPCKEIMEAISKID